MSSKFQVNVILCARPSDSITSFTRKQYQNAVIGADIQMLWCDWCGIHTLMRQSDWCEIHAKQTAIWSLRNTYPNAAVWLLRAKYLSTPKQSTTNVLYELTKAITCESFPLTVVLTVEMVGVFVMYSNSVLWHSTHQSVLMSKMECFANRSPLNSVVSRKVI